jgi:hypothetical protein
MVDRPVIGGGETGLYDMYGYENHQQYNNTAMGSGKWFPAVALQGQQADGK